MEFIGIGLKQSDDTTTAFDLIRDKAAEHDLLVSKTISHGHFRDGLANFSAFKEVSLLQFSAFDEASKTASSRQISTELIEYKSTDTEVNFLNFLTEETAALPETFYLIFACDWFEADPIRLEKIAIADLKAHFKRNTSWYLWLYNYGAERYYPQLELPLVLEVRNSR